MRGSRKNIKEIGDTITKLERSEPITDRLPDPSLGANLDEGNRMNVSASLIVAGLALLPTAAAAGGYDGNQLLAFCERDKEFVYGYVTATIDQAANDATIVNTSQPFTSIIKNEGQTLGRLIQSFCIPEDAMVKQVSDIVCNYVRDHAEKRHYVAASLTVLALKAAWPCPTQ